MRSRASTAFSRTVPSYVQPMIGAGFGVGGGALGGGSVAVAAMSVADGAAGAVEVHDTATTRTATKAKRNPVRRTRGYTRPATGGAEQFSGRSIARVRASPVRPLAVMLASLLPTALLAWYLSDPARNQPIDIRLEHFVITSNVSVVAALVAFLVARAALGVGHYRALLIALGFATGFIHYLLDRSVYRMSDPRVRAAASGLIGNVTRRSRTKNVSSFALVFFLAYVSASSLQAQIGTPAARPQPPKAIYTPRPVYRPEWAKQGLAGKGVVLVTIDQQTGKVTGARMLESTGNKQLDGAALEAYSQWRFQPGTGSQVKIPIEFASRSKPPAAKQAKPPSAILYPLLILLGFGVAVLVMRGRRRA